MNDQESVRRTRTVTCLGLLFPAVNGLTTGFYILTYTAIAGAIGSRLLRDHGLGDVSAESIGLVYVASMFALEWRLEIVAGAIAHRLGTRTSMLLSFALRAVFLASLLAMISVGPKNEALQLLSIVISVVSFALSYSLFTGNFPQWIRAQLPPAQQASRLFSFTTAIQYLFMMVGGLASLWCLSRSANVVSASPLRSLIERGMNDPLNRAPFLLGVIACLAVGAATQLIPDDGSTRVLPPREMIDTSYGELLKNPLLKKLFWMAALIYGQLNALSVLLPLVVLPRTNVLISKAMLLVFAQYGPVFLGGVLAATRTVARASTDTTLSAADIAIEKHGALRLAVLASSVLLVFAFAFSRWDSGVVPLIIPAGLLFSWRFVHGHLDPRFQFLTSELAKTGSHPKVLLSIGERYKKGVALVVLLVPALISANVGHDRTSQLGVATWSIAGIAVSSGVAIYLLARSKQSGE